MRYIRKNKRSSVNYVNNKKLFSLLVTSLEGISFGLVDGAICAVGAAVGIATATNDILLSLLAVLIFGLSDSFGNAAGFYLSQVSERNIQMMKKKQGKLQHIHTKEEVLFNGVFTFIATFIVYIIIALPFMFLSLNLALITAIFIAAIITFLLGAYNARLVGDDEIKKGSFYASITILTSILCYLFGSILSGLI